MTLFLWASINAIQKLRMCLTFELIKHELAMYIFFKTIILANTITLLDSSFVTQTIF